MLNKVWLALKASGLGFFTDGCLSRGAAIAYYTVFSLAPVLLIVVAIAGLVFGDDAARGAVRDQISGLMGPASADAIQGMIQNASNKHAGIIATVVGGVTLLVAASGVFLEMQTALNAIWKVEPPEGMVSQLVRARLQSLGLVMTLGFLLMVSLLISAALAALDTFLAARLPGVHLALRGVSLVLSFGLITLLFAAIYKVLPDTDVAWRDVAIGAVVTALLFTLGKYGISLYISIGSSRIATTYGAAGALAIILVWIYYSSQIFLLGAEFTMAWAQANGSHVGRPPGSRRGHGEIARLKATLESNSAPRRRWAAPWRTRDG